MSEKITLIKDTINNEDIDNLIKWLKTYPRLTKSAVTLEFEKKWAKWLGTKYAVFVNSGSSANLLMLYALIVLKKLPNNKVVVPGLVWATDVAPIMQLGLEPILCDIDLDTLSVDINQLELNFVINKPAALLLVSIIGFSPKMKEIVALCKKYNVILLEDNCESLGTEYDGVKLGNFGLMSSFSTYFGHHISTIEGGMITTNDKQIYEMLLSIRSHGWDRDLSKSTQKELRKKYKVSEFDALYTFYYPGFNLRSTDLQAFIGLGQLDRLDWICKRRSVNFNEFQFKIQNPFWKPKPVCSFTSNFCYPIIHPNREKIIKHLQKNNIESRPLVCGSMGRQPFFTNIYGVCNLPSCDKVRDFGLYVPNNPSLQTKEINKIVEVINKITDK